MIIPPENLEDIAKKFGFGKYAKKTDKKIITEIPPSYVSLTEDGYVFHNVPYDNGYFEEIGLVPGWLCNGKMKSYEEWMKFSETNQQNIKLPNLKITYQLIRIIHKVTKSNDELAIFYANDLCKYLIKLNFTSTRILNIGPELEDKVIEHPEYDGTTSVVTVKMPYFEHKHNKAHHADLWYNLTIEQELDDQIKPILKALLGPGYKQAEEVLESVIPRDDIRSYKVGIDLPKPTNHYNKWEVFLGKYDNQQRGIKFIDQQPSPARGVIIDPAKFRKLEVG